jgi:hypothetical protein
MLDTFRENSTTLIDEIVKPLNEARIPFSSAHGVCLKLYGWAGNIPTFHLSLEP